MPSVPIRDSFPLTIGGYDLSCCFNADDLMDLDSECFRRCTMNAHAMMGSNGSSDTLLYLGLLYSLRESYKEGGHGLLRLSAVQRWVVEAPGRRTEFEVAMAQAWGVHRAADTEKWEKHVEQVAQELGGAMGDPTKGAEAARSSASDKKDRKSTAKKKQSNADDASADAGA